MGSGVFDLLLEAQQYYTAGVINPSSQKSLLRKIPLAKSLHRKIPPSNIPPQENTSHQNISRQNTYKQNISNDKKPTLNGFCWHIFNEKALLLSQICIFHPWSFILINLIIMTTSLLQFWPYWSYQNLKLKLTF